MVIHTKEQVVGVQTVPHIIFILTPIMSWKHSKALLFYREIALSLMIFSQVWDGFFQGTWHQISEKSLCKVSVSSGKSGIKGSRLETRNMMCSHTHLFWRVSGLFLGYSAGLVLPIGHLCWSPCLAWSRRWTQVPGPGWFWQASPDLCWMFRRDHTG